jgi:hypothetical protein
MRDVQHVPAIAAGACLLALAVCSVLRADTVILTNGHKLEGHVIDNGDTITVEMAQGNVTVAKTRVKSIDGKVTAPDEFRRQVLDIQVAVEKAELEPGAAAERFFALAQWADEQGLPRARAEALKRALESDPEHVGARRASGFVRHEGRWVTRTERYQALGMVLYNGHWVPPEAKEDAERAKVDARRREAADR